MSASQAKGGSVDGALYLIAVLKPRSDREAEVRAALHTLISASQAEPGCRYYDLVVGEDDPSTWFMFEKWESQAAWDEHMQTAHVRGFNARAEEYFREATELRRYVDR